MTKFALLSRINLHRIQTVPISRPVFCKLAHAQKTNGDADHAGLVEIFGDCLVNGQQLLDMVVLLVLLITPISRRLSRAFLAQLGQTEKCFKFETAKFKSLITKTICLQFRLAHFVNGGIVHFGG